MPTMGKLFSAIMLGVLGYYVADLVGGHLPDEVRQNALRPITAIFGVLVGWKFLGRRLRGDWPSAIGLGLSSSVVLALIALLWFSGYEMIRRALRLAYGGDPFLALQDMFQIAADNLQFLAQPDVIFAAVLGSIGIGVVATAVSRIWP